jgi:hypothetical protein
VVNDALNTIFLAIVDLIKYSKDINLNFGFARLTIKNRGLKVTFTQDYQSNCADKQIEQ